MSGMSPTEVRVQSDAGDCIAKSAKVDMRSNPRVLANNPMEFAGLAIALLPLPQQTECSKPLHRRKTQKIFVPVVYFVAAGPG